ncbi:hypothetical protein HK101_005520 [Irineochytrium annulatum]|nr:hypothetical protein HK101_005520 [Irineochytrium annulatum]
MGLYSRWVGWGCGFGPKDMFDYTEGMTILPLNILSENDKRWIAHTKRGGGPLVGGTVIEEPDVGASGGAGRDTAIGAEQMPPPELDPGVSTHDTGFRGRGARGGRGRGGRGRGEWPPRGRGGYTPFIVHQMPPNGMFDNNAYPGMFDMNAMNAMGGYYGVPNVPISQGGMVNTPNDNRGYKVERTGSTDNAEDDLPYQPTAKDNHRDLPQRVEPSPKRSVPESQQSPRRPEERFYDGEDGALGRSTQPPPANGGGRASFGGENYDQYSNPYGQPSYNSGNKSYDTNYGSNVRMNAPPSHGQKEAGKFGKMNDSRRELLEGPRRGSETKAADLVSNDGSGGYGARDRPGGGHETGEHIGYGAGNRMPMEMGRGRGGWPMHDEERFNYERGLGGMGMSRDGRGDFGPGNRQPPGWGPQYPMMGMGMGPEGYGHGRGVPPHGMPPHGMGYYGHQQYPPLGRGYGGWDDMPREGIPQLGREGMPPPGREGMPPPGREGMTPSEMMISRMPMGRGRALDPRFYGPSPKPQSESIPAQVKAPPSWQGKEEEQVVQW